MQIKKALATTLLPALALSAATTTSTTAGKDKTTSTSKSSVSTATAKNLLTSTSTNALSSASKSSAGSVPASCTISQATATAQTDLDKFQGCSTLVGNLTISGDLGNAALADVKKIDGSLTVFNATSLNTFAADALQEVTGHLTLQQLTLLYSVSFGSLQKVDSINLITLPSLQTFSSSLEYADSILVSDTTLESIEGFSTLKTVTSFNINNNKLLTRISSSLQTVSDTLQVSSNGDDTTTSFDDLIWANNITFRDVDSVSFASLQNVNASLGFLNNTVQSLNLTKLATIGQSLTITANDDLTSINFGNLTSVGGGFVIANNTALRTIDGFSKVSTIGGALQAIGSFSEFKLDSLKSVKGGADIETTAANFSCSAFDSLHAKGAIQGDLYVCKKPEISSSSSSQSTSSSATETKNKTTKTSSSTSVHTTLTYASSNNSSTSSHSTKKSITSNSRGGALAVAPYFPAGIMGSFAAIALSLL